MVARFQKFNCIYICLFCTGFQFEQSNCIDWINVCYIRSLIMTKIYNIFIGIRCWAMVRNGNSISVDFTDTIRIQERHLILLLLDYLAVVYYEYTYIVGTYKIHMHSLPTEQKSSPRLAFLSVSKARTNKLYIFWQCTGMYIVYIL